MHDKGKIIAGLVIFACAGALSPFWYWASR
jgi:hypothetical protein